MKLIELIKQGESHYQYETLRFGKNGKKIYVSIIYSPVFDNNGKLTAITIIGRDVTERKRAEEKLRESEEKYRNIVETANEGILVTNNENIIRYVNKKFADMLLYTAEEIIGLPIWGFISEEYIPIVQMNLKKRRMGEYGSYELKLKRKDGSPHWIILNAKPLFDKEGKYIGAMSMLTDINERKKTEEALRNFEIAQKKEIHHRIKNNLQVISSLLDLQADLFRGRKNIKDSEVLKAFKQSIDRVLSIALIHEELYKGKNIELLNFSQYIKELADNLLLTYKLETDINFIFDLEKNVFLEMDTAIPLGIVINELVTNSFKYAFSGRDKGEIRLKLHRDKSEGCNTEGSITNITLSVSDNGIGIPSDLDIEDLDSLGLQLVTTLVEQLDGELELKRDNGTEFIIRFTVMKNNNQGSEPQLVNNE
jgi:PAS domain S-box-containing protein